MRRLALCAFACALVAAGCYHFDDDLSFCQSEGRCRDGGAAGGGEGGGGGTDAGGGAGGGVGGGVGGGGGGGSETDAGDLCPPKPLTGSFAPIVCNVNGFCWEHPYPAGVKLEAVAPAGPCEAWVVGDRQTALHYLNGVWSADTNLLQDSATADKNLYAVGANAAGQFWAAGTSSELYQLDTGNSQSAPGSNFSASAMRLRDDGRFVVAGTTFQSFYAGSILEQNDAGVFETVYGSNDDPAGVFYDLAGTGAGSMIAVGDIAARYDDAGWSFEDGGETPPTTALSAWRASDGTLWVGGAGGLYWRAPGDTWHQVGSFGNADVAVSGSGDTVYVVNGTDLWTCSAVASNACKLRAASAVSLPDDFQLRKPWLVDVEISGDAVWLAGDYGAFARGSVSHPDAGIRSLLTGTREFLYAVYAGPGGDEWAVGRAGTVLRRDPVQGWVQVPSPTSNDLRGVSRTATGELVIVGDQAALQLVEDGGLTAIGVYDSTGAPKALDFILNGISTGGGRTFVVGQFGAIFEWVNGKLQEVPATQETTADLDGIFVTDAGTAWAVGGNGTVRYFDGGTWASRAAVGSQDLSRVWVNGTDDVYALSYTSSAVKHFVGFTGTATNMQTGMSQYAQGISGTSANDIWVVGDEEIAHFTGSWDVVNPQTTTDFFAVTMRNGAPLFVGEGGAIISTP